MSDCLFCKIAAKQIPAKVVQETPDWLAFRDINPQAPTHVLVIPRKHVATVDDVDAATAGMLVEAGAKVAKAEGLSSYRMVFNCNEDAGQTVFHLHLHVLGGRRMTWPPG